MRSLKGEIEDPKKNRYIYTCKPYTDGNISFNASPPELGESFK